MARFDLLESLTSLRVVCESEDVFRTLEAEVIGYRGNCSAMARYLSILLAVGYSPDFALRLWNAGVPVDMARALKLCRLN